MKKKEVEYWESLGISKERQDEIEKELKEIRKQIMGN
jgi:hypothetical protein